MARFDIGKLKLNLSRQGFAFKWGDGNVHRLPFPGGAEPEEETYRGREDYAEDGYEEDSYEEDRYREDRYDRRSSYADDAYDREDDRRGDYYADEDDYADSDGDDRYDRRYDEDDYDRDDYDRSDYADAYDRPRGRFSEEEPDDEYDQAEDDEEEAPNRFMSFIESNDWVTLALLVLLPPLGIYLLWRRRCYEMPIRAAMSIASLVWFLVLLFLLIPMIFGGKGDPSTTPTSTLTLTTQTPAATANTGTIPIISATIAPTDNSGASSGSTSLEPGATAEATPLPGSSDASAEEYVYSPSTGAYYHAREDCSSIPTGVTTTRMTVAAAANRGQTACPVCYEGTLYYTTANGTHYHVDPTCSNMVNPYTITKEAAEQQGKTACPDCIKPEGDTPAATPGTYTGVLTGVTNDKSGQKVWATVDGSYYHVKSNCSNMKNAVQVGLLKAIQAGKTACPTCAATAGAMVWCTKYGNYFHSKSDCSGMTGAVQITYAEALVLGKAVCPVCLSSFAGSTSSGDTSGTIFVYATADGKYYHSKEDCSGMKNATRVTLQAMLKAGRPPCPVCCPNANRIVYANSGGQYYHSKSTCRDMRNAPKVTLAKALAAGKKKCPYCWGN